MTFDPNKEELFRRARAAVKLDQYARVLACMIHYGQERALEIAPRFGPVSPWSEHRSAPPGVAPRSPGRHPGAETADISAFVPRVSLPFESKPPEDDSSKPR